MKRKIIGAGLFCLLLFAAILAGYWDMLSTEKLRIVRDEASQAVGEIADVVRPGAPSVDSSAADPAPTPAPSSGSEGTPSPEGAPAATPGQAPGSDAPSTTVTSEAPSAPPAPSAAPANPPASTAEATAAPGSAPNEATPGSVTAPSDAPASPAPTEAPAAGDAASGPAPAKTAPQEPASTVAEPVTANAPLALPTFDIVRVEPDGSTVLAGRAPAGSAILLRDGQTTVGEDKASASGDFVVALDERLAVGEHQLTLEATAPDGRVATSAETVIVSIPQKGRENELLAMVESPDQPSRLISIPAAAPAGREPAAPSAASPADSAAVAAPLLPSSAPEAQGDLTLPLTPGETSAPSQPATPLAVEAVEIDGDQIYIAGRAAGAASVRVYIDNEFLSAAPKLLADRFLVTAKAPVLPGEHLVRADALNAAGAVIARVEVPFNRPEGRAMSAISAPTAPVTASPPAPAAKAAPTDAAASAAGDGAPAEPAPAAQVATAPAGPSAVSQSPTPPPAAPVPAAPVLAEPAPADAVDPSVAVAPLASSPPAETLAAAPAATTTPAGSESPAVAATAPGEDVAVLRQPALEAVEARVIIRRGDTLWRISRDTYGRGARYTVIYLANGDQIRDPNRIYPGQVFRTPKDE
jgi:nucleoid-associated protein YgaU